jgi:hypothetical protein
MNVFKITMNNIEMINPVIYRKRRDMSFNKTIFAFLITLIFCIYINITADIRELKYIYFYTKNYKK